MTEQEYNKRLQDITADIKAGKFHSKQAALEAIKLVNEEYQHQCKLRKAEQRASSNVRSYPGVRYNSTKSMEDWIKNSSSSNRHDVLRHADTLRSAGYGYEADKYLEEQIRNFRRSNREY